jgi:hypothetical protein
MRHHFRHPQAMFNKGSLFYSHCGPASHRCTHLPYIPHLKAKGYINKEVSSSPVKPADIFGSDQTTGCPRNHMKTFSNIDGLRSIQCDSSIYVHGRNHF